jgi:hypothetical protein
MGLLRWLARRIASEMPPPLPPPPPARIDVAAALETLLVGSVRAAGEALAVRTDADTNFIRQMAEFRSKSAAQALGAAGGRTTQARRKAAKIAADPTWCPVCKHDNTRSSRAIIKWHIGGHRGSRPPMEVRATDDEPGKAGGNTREKRSEAMQSETAESPGEHEAAEHPEPSDKTG